MTFLIHSTMETLINNECLLPYCDQHHFVTPSLDANFFFTLHPRGLPDGKKEIFSLVLFLTFVSLIVRNGGYLLETCSVLKCAPCPSHQYKSPKYWIGSLSRVERRVDSVERGEGFFFQTLFKLRWMHKRRTFSFFFPFPFSFSLVVQVNLIVSFLTLL
jgi:hypothetical protein